jgi:hypothetical protein
LFQIGSISSEPLATKASAGKKWRQYSRRDPA